MGEKSLGALGFNVSNTQGTWRWKNMHPSTSCKHLLEECPTPWALAHTSYQNSTHLDPKAIVLLPHNPFWCFVHVHFKVMS
jgi:hypothetical protein